MSPIATFLFSIPEKGDSNLTRFGRVISLSGKAAKVYDAKTIEGFKKEATMPVDHFGSSTEMINTAIYNSLPDCRKYFIGNTASKFNDLDGLK
jgi:hypothetical protein